MKSEDSVKSHPKNYRNFIVLTPTIRFEHLANA